MEMTRISCFAALYIFLSPIIKAFNSSSLNPPKLPPRKQLFKDLMLSYGSTSVRPVWNENGPIEVRFSFILSILASFDEKKQHLSVVGDLSLGWKDELLTWNPDDYGGINRISLRQEDLWTPDITAYERIGDGSARANIFDPYIIVNSSGHVNYFDLTYLTVYCRVDMVLFPFDTQMCGIKFLSYGYDSDQLTLKFLNTAFEEEGAFKTNGVWRLVNVDVQEVQQLYACCPNPFVEVRFKMELQRIGNFYIYSLGLPSVLLSVLLLAVFLMHPNSGEKVSLSVNNVLAFVLFQQMVVANTPMSGEDAPIVVTYFSVMITVSCLSVLASALVLRVYHHASDEPVPYLLRCLIQSKNLNTRGTDHLENVSKIDKYDIALHQLNMEEHRRVLASQSNIQDAPLNRRERSSSNVVNEGGNIVLPVDEELENSHIAHNSKRKAEEWKLLALRLDKIFLISVIFILIATMCYCAIQFKIYSQKSKDGSSTPTRSFYRTL